MLRRSLIAILAIAAFGISLNSTKVSAAGLGGGGVHSHSLGLHFSNRHFPRHDHRAFAPFAGYGYMPYGGFTGADLSGMLDYSNYFTNPIGLFSMLRLLNGGIPPSIAPSCKHSVETKTVPSEDGGERKITITRC